MVNAGARFNDRRYEVRAQGRNWLSTDRSFMPGRVGWRSCVPIVCGARDRGQVRGVNCRLPLLALKRPGEWLTRLSLKALKRNFQVEIANPLTR